MKKISTKISIACCFIAGISSLWGQTNDTLQQDEYKHCAAIFYDINYKGDVAANLCGGIQKGVAYWDMRNGVSDWMLSDWVGGKAENSSSKAPTPMAAVQPNNSLEITRWWTTSKPATTPTCRSCGLNNSSAT